MAHPSAGLDPAGPAVQAGAHRDGVEQRSPSRGWLHSGGGPAYRVVRRQPATPQPECDTPARGSEPSLDLWCRTLGQTHAGTKVVCWRRVEGANPAGNTGGGEPEITPEVYLSLTLIEIRGGSDASGAIRELHSYLTIKSSQPLSPDIDDDLTVHPGRRPPPKERTEIEVLNHSV